MVVDIWRPQPPMAPLHFGSTLPMALKPHSSEYRRLLPATIYTEKYFIKFYSIVGVLQSSIWNECDLGQHKFCAAHSVLEECF